MIATLETGWFAPGRAWRAAETRWPSASMRVNFSQRIGLAVAQPGDVADAPVVLELDEVEPDGHRLVEVRELDGGGGFAGGAVLDRDIEGGNLPILRVDEWIEIEQPDLAALGGSLLVFGHQRCQRRLEITANGLLIVERMALGVLALIG